MSYHIVQRSGWGGPYGIARIGATETETMGSKLKGWLIAAGLIGLALIAMKATNRKKRRNPARGRRRKRRKPVLGERQPGDRALAMARRSIVRAKMSGPSMARFLEYRMHPERRPPPPPRQLWSVTYWSKPQRASSTSRRVHRTFRTKAEAQKVADGLRKKGRRGVSLARTKD